MTSDNRDLGFVKKLSNEAVQCRSLRHQFDLEYFGRVSGLKEFDSKFSPTTIVRISVCRRCGVNKEDFFNPANASRLAMGMDFVSFYRRYRYPSNYSWKSSESSKDRPVNGDYNLELYRRYLKGD